MAPDSLLPLTLVISSVTRIGPASLFLTSAPFHLLAFLPKQATKMESLPQDKSGYLLLQSYILLLSLCWGCEIGSHVPQPGFELAGQTGLEDLICCYLPLPAKPSLFSNPLTYVADDNRSGSLFRWGLAFLARKQY